jgi:hypothetical protein
MNVKCDFRRIAVENIEGTTEFIDLSKPLGNALYMQGKDIVECELGRDIWHKGEVELTDEQAAAVKRFAAGYSYVVRTAIEKAVEGVKSE